MKTLAIILPCYNPPEGWDTSIVSNYKELKERLGFAPQLIIVNDGSTQNMEQEIAFITEHIADFIFIDLQKNNGKGYALRAGIRAAHSTFYIYTDIDFPYTTDSFMAIYDALQKGQDVAAGIKDQCYYTHTPFARKQISKILRFLIRSFLKIPISDTQCGLKGFNNKGKEYFLATTIDRYLFDLEFIYLSTRKKNNIQLTAIASQLRPDIIFRKMNFKILFQEGKNFLKILFQ